MADTVDNDTDLSADGRVMEVLSEHLCEGWLEGYLLTGRHGLFSCYEAFIHIIDSMFNQHAKWLEGQPQDPVAQADRVAEHPAHLARLAAGPQRPVAPGPGLHGPRRQQVFRGGAHLPAAGCELPAVGGRPLPAQSSLRQRHRRRQAARVAVADMDAAVRHCTAGAGVWAWAGTEDAARAGPRRGDGLRRRRADPGMHWRP
jgi:xylulose-5-phosphate/fructose-6-phosphate phosphoketolase